MNDEYPPRPSAEYGAAGYAPRGYSTPGSQFPPPVLQPAPSRLPWLLMMLAVLAIMLIGPHVLERFQYSSTYGKERAKVDVAIEGLAQLDRMSLEGLAEASRLVAQKVGPSVVHLRVERLTNEPRNADLTQMFEAPRMQQSLGEGSGVIVDSAGYIVTNYHVVANETGIDVQLADGRHVSGTVVGSDEPTDIAVVQIEADNLIATAWGDSDELEVGDLIWAVGSPFGLDRSVTFGIVSAKGRRGVTNSRYQEFLQTDAAVNPGNSGGPLVNIRGEIVGINTAIVGPAYQGISFAIPSSIAREIYEKLKSGKPLVRGWLGVKLEPLTAQQIKDLGLSIKQGVAVNQVLPNSPASLAGVQKGDVLLEWNGKRVEDPQSLSWMVANTPVGSKAALRVRRDGSDLTLPVEVGELPDELK